MKVSFDDAGENINFRIYDYDQKYEKLFQMCFYEPVKNGYIKTYPKTAKYIDKIMSRYEKYAKEMFDQLGYFSDVPWEKGLEDFCSYMQKANIDWWLTGSCAACIRGIKLQPHDIDIMVDSRDIPVLTEILQGILIEPIVDTNGWLTKDFGVVFNHCRIDIASDPSKILDDPEPVDCGPYAKKHLEEVMWNKFRIKIPPVELQITVNRKRKRMDRVRAMEEYLGRQI